MFPFPNLHVFAVLWILTDACFAQTHTECNPLQKTCPVDQALPEKSVFTKFSGNSMPPGWKKETSAGDIVFDNNGANLVINKQGDSPALVSDFYIFFGSVEVTAKVASGAGIVSSIVLISDDLDETDWEFVGVDTGHAQSNYFGKGDDSTFDRGAKHAVSSPQTTLHTYKIDWTPKAIVWSVDGVPVRKTTYSEAKAGSRFPQTPSVVKIGLWAAGDPSMPDGTADWAGGRTDYSQAPFVFQVVSAKVVNYSPAKTYAYGDRSGSFESIIIDGGVLMSNDVSNVGIDVPKIPSESLTSLPPPSPPPTHVPSVVKPPPPVATKPLVPSTPKTVPQPPPKTPVQPSPPPARTSKAPALSTGDASTVKPNHVSVTSFSLLVFLGLFMGLFA